jgi:superfamily II DNA or RNA helicase
MDKPNWSYQAKMIAEVLANVRRDISPLPAASKGCVLAGGTSSGKTRMALQVVDQLLNEGVIKNALILTHGQIVLRSQMADEANKLNASGLVSFTHQEVEAGDDIGDSQVTIAIPHSLIKKANPPTFDLVVIDEAHEFYFAKDGMVQKIIERCGARYILFLTGTPSKFIADGKFPIVAISVMELRQHNVVTSPVIRMAQSAYDFTQSDINQQQNLCGSASYTPQQTQTTMDDILSIISRELHPGAETTDWRDVFPTFGKTMIACHSQRQARQVRDYFAKQGVPVGLGTSDDDPTAGEIKRFVDDPQLMVLIVVCRGILGFSCEEMVNLVDMTCTQNIDRLAQLFGRILRLHPKAETQKLFLKVVPHHLVDYNYHLMNFVLSLCERSQYLSYAGNFRETSFITRIEPNPDVPPSSDRKREPPVWTLPTFEILKRLYVESDEALYDYAYTTLDDILGSEVPLETRCAMVKALLDGRSWLTPEEKKRAAAWKAALLGRFRRCTRNHEWISTVSAILGPDFLTLERRTRIEPTTVRTVEEWVSVAEQLTKDNGGKLPLPSWLKKHGYGGLPQVMRKSPELFAHLTQEENKFTSVEEWVRVAEELAAHNGGRLPSKKWLRTNGYRQVLRLVQERPEFLAHIQKEENPHKLAEEWVVTAEQLAATNGGVLHHLSWLEKNGYINLSQVLRRRRDLFAHIPQEIRDNRGDLVDVRKPVLATA